jgi:hypothetical protein
LSHSASNKKKPVRVSVQCNFQFTLPTKKLKSNQSGSLPPLSSIFQTETPKRIKAIKQGVPIFTKEASQAVSESGINQDILMPENNFITKSISDSPLIKNKTNVSIFD